MGTDSRSTTDEQGWRDQATRDAETGDPRASVVNESLEEWEARMDRAHAARAALELAEQHSRVRPYIVYRLYDWDNDLSYVGVTKDLARRIEQHRSLQKWWCDIDHDIIVTDAFASAEAAADWESLLITERQPRYNVAGTAGRKHGRYDPDRTPRRPLKVSK